MTAEPAAVEAGLELPPLTARITREDLIRYAGAAMDFNPIHWSERQATEAGLPGVIAHGMLTMALAARLVTDWAGDSGRIVDVYSRFTRPVVVPDDDEGAEVELTGKVSAVEDGRATVAVTAKFEGRPVLGKATVIVSLP